MIYTGRGKEEDIENVLAKFKKGHVVSVKGFVSQRAIESPTGEKSETQYKNTYFVTSFLTSGMEADFDELEE